MDKRIPSMPDFQSMTLRKRIMPFIAPRRCLQLAVLAAAVSVSGCSHIGPDTVTVDRFDYSSTIAESWKEQLLLNIVKLRYMDLPVFIDVSSIVAGYSLETAGSLAGQISSADAIQGNSVLLGASGKYTDRPTITYVPLTGQKFLAGLLTPIDPKNIFSMLQSGYAADFVLGLTVDALNGVRNRSAVAGIVREADPEFIRALQLLREIQAAGAVGMRVETDKDKGKTAVLFMRSNDIQPEILLKQKEVRRLLHLPEGRQQFVLRYSPVRGDDNELAVSSRSMLQIMTAYSSFVDIPAEHLEDHSALPSLKNGDVDRPETRILIRSGKTKPKHAYTAVYYRDYWFWIDDSNLAAKRALSAAIFFFTLAETGDNEKLPLITIPAQ